MTNKVKRIYEGEFKPVYEAGNGREYKLIFAIELNRTLGNRAIDIGRLVMEGAK